jgi:uncharacterized protein YecE (DUF72 family)
MRILAGTSGFSFPEWKGSFYPEDMAAKDMLRYYAQRFPTVEINNTFYQLPKAPVLESWVNDVPNDFRFVLKCSQFITHIKRLKEPAAPLAVLFSATKVLGPQLGASLFQLPPNMRKDVERFSGFLDALPKDKRVAIEFRHDTWFDDEIFELLRKAGVALCVADTGEEPAAPLVATTDWGYLRLRRETFSDRELKAWVKRIQEQPWTDAYVFLKHEEEGIGPKLAARVMKLADVKS